MSNIGKSGIPEFYSGSINTLNNSLKPEARYSGPGRSGICICGCPWDVHHLCIVMRQDYTDATEERYIPDECCAFGFNETGGMKYNPVTQEWEDHCHGYVDAGTNDVLPILANFATPGL
jgi:hypothetical protein